ncbi:MAG: hypothetical protein IKX40_13770, partial [Thermoguttaceae bacterium]|nr:hypothetical protein [Thermoguttaceae bacterium]
EWGLGNREWGRVLLTGGGYYPPKNNQPLIIADNVRSPETTTPYSLFPTPSSIFSLFFKKVNNPSLHLFKNNS